MVKLFLENKMSINATDKKENNILHFLCYNENINENFEIVKFFLEEKLDPNFKNGTRETPSFYACLNENVSLNLLEKLYRNGFAFDEPTYLDNLPLHMLCQNENFSIEMIDFLLKFQIDDYGNIDNHTPLHFAAMNPNTTTEIMKKLKSSVKSKWDSLPTLHFYLLNENVKQEIIDLFEYETRVHDSEDLFPLNYAAQNVHIDVDLLKSIFLKFENCEEDKYIVAQYLSSICQQKTTPKRKAEMLYSILGEISIKERKPLKYCGGIFMEDFMADQQCYLEFKEMDKNSLVNKTTLCGKTLFHLYWFSYAVSIQHTKLFLENEEVDIVDNSLSTAFHCFAYFHTRSSRRRKSNIPILKYFLCHGYDPTLSNLIGDSPFSLMKLIVFSEDGNVKKQIFDEFYKLVETHVKVGSIWSTENHSFFSKQFNQTSKILFLNTHFFFLLSYKIVISFLICLKIYSSSLKNKFLIVPKPIAKMIIFFISVKSYACSSLQKNNKKRKKSLTNQTQEKKIKN